MNLKREFLSEGIIFRELPEQTEQEFTELGIDCFFSELNPDKYLEIAERTKEEWNRNDVDTDRKMIIYYLLEEVSFGWDAESIILEEKIFIVQFFTKVFTIIKYVYSETWKFFFLHEIVFLQDLEGGCNAFFDPYCMVFSLNINELFNIYEGNYLS